MPAQVLHQSGRVLRAARAGWRASDSIAVAGLTPSEMRGALGDGRWSMGKGGGRKSIDKGTERSDVGGRLKGRWRNSEGWRSL